LQPRGLFPKKQVDELDEFLEQQIMTLFTHGAISQ
jgi:hypothetical protein